jgi:hypothetical protein
MSLMSQFSATVLIVPFAVWPGLLQASFESNRGSPNLRVSTEAKDNLKTMKQ